MPVHVWIGTLMFWKCGLRQQEWTFNRIWYLIFKARRVWVFTQLRLISMDNLFLARLIEKGTVTRLVWKTEILPFFHLLLSVNDKERALIIILLIIDFVILLLLDLNDRLFLAFLHWPGHHFVSLIDQTLLFFTVNWSKHGFAIPHASIWQLIYSYSVRVGINTIPLRIRTGHNCVLDCAFESLEELTEVCALCGVVGANFVNLALHDVRDRGLVRFLNAFKISEGLIVFVSIVRRQVDYLGVIDCCKIDFFTVLILLSSLRTRWIISWWISILFPEKHRTFIRSI